MLKSSLGCWIWLIPKMQNLEIQSQFIVMIGPSLKSSFGQVSMWELKANRMFQDCHRPLFANKCIDEAVVGQFSHLYAYRRYKEHSSYVLWWLYCYLRPVFDRDRFGFIKQVGGRKTITRLAFPNKCMNEAAVGQVSQLRVCIKYWW